MNRIIKKLSVMIALTINVLTFCAAQLKKGRPATGKRINVGAAAKGAPKDLNQKRKQEKASGDKKTAAAATPNKPAVVANPLVAKKYAIAQYDPTAELNAAIAEKLETLNEYTQKIITAKTIAYFKAHPKDNKETIIKGIIATFNNDDHFKTYKKHFLKIDKDYGDPTKKLKALDAKNAFNTLLVNIQAKLEDDHLPCSGCEVM